MHTNKDLLRSFSATRIHPRIQIYEAVQQANICGDWFLLRLCCHQLSASCPGRAQRACGSALWRGWLKHCPHKLQQPHKHKYSFPVPACCCCCCCYCQTLKLFLWVFILWEASADQYVDWILSARERWECDSRLGSQGPCGWKLNHI